MNDTLNAVRIKPQITRKVIWRLAPLLILLYVVNQMDRANVGYAALTMNHELGMSVSQFGFAAGLFYAGYILVAVPSNLMLARFGARIWMTRILVTWGIVASLTAFVDSAHTLYVLRFLLGVAESGFFPGMVLYVTFWLPRQERVWLMSLLFLSIPLSNMLGAPISTFVMEHAHLFGWSGWRSMFFIEGLPAIALGVVTFVLMKDRPDDAAWLTVDERAELNRALAAERQEANRVSPQSAWRALLDRRVLADVCRQVFRVPDWTDDGHSVCGVGSHHFALGTLCAAHGCQRVACRDSNRGGRLIVCRGAVPVLAL
jgi:ACS family tartrate transporter-like MFS transporter